jgi:hypothetical protein
MLYQWRARSSLGSLTAGFHSDDENTIEVYIRPIYLGGPTFVNRSE